MTALALLIAYGVLSAGFALFLGLMGAGEDLLLELRHETAAGTVDSFGRGETGVQFVLFRFRTGDGQELVGHSYTADATRAAALLPRAAVTVEYVPAKPWISRIKGLRSSAISWRPLHSLLLRFFLLGGVLVAGVVVVYLRRRRLCESGVVATGTVLAPGNLVRLFARKLSTRGRWKWSLLSYSFEDQGGTTHVRCMSTTGRPVSLQPGDAVTVIYNARRPRASIALDVHDVCFEGAHGQTAAEDVSP